MSIVKETPKLSFFFLLFCLEGLASIFVLFPNALISIILLSLSLEEDEYVFPSKLSALACLVCFYWPALYKMGKRLLRYVAGTQRPSLPGDQMDKKLYAVMKSVYSHSHTPKCMDFVLCQFTRQMPWQIGGWWPHRNSRKLMNLTPAHARSHRDTSDHRTDVMFGKKKAEKRSHT